jgi:hypothetical protein
MGVICCLSRQENRFKYQNQRLPRCLAQGDWIRWGKSPHRNAAGLKWQGSKFKTFNKQYFSISYIFFWESPKPRFKILNFLPNEVISHLY